jgi:hypothetical protein
MNAARIAGKSDDELRALVAEPEKARRHAADAVPDHGHQAVAELHQLDQADQRLHGEDDLPVDEHGRRPEQVLGEHRRGD